MPWDDSGFAGFSIAAPWLPIADEHRPLSVNRQELNQQSTLNRFKAFLRWRKQQPVLISGDIAIRSIHESVFTFERTFERERMFLAFNLSDDSVQIEAPFLRNFTQIDSIGLTTGELVSGRIRIPPHGVVFAVPR
jgi:alpha-glucosidase